MSFDETDLPADRKIPEETATPTECHTGKTAQH